MKNSRNDIDDHYLQVEELGRELFSIIFLEYGYTRKQITSKCRKGELIIFRRIMYTILKKYTKASLSTLGKYMGGQDHATVLNALNVHERKMESHPKKEGHHVDQQYADYFYKIHYHCIKNQNTEESLIFQKKVLIKKASEIQEKISSINDKLNSIENAKRKISLKQREVLFLQD